MAEHRKLAIIVSINDKYNYLIRTVYTTRIFREYGYDVQVISSDFDHRKKCRYIDHRPGLIQIFSIPYAKNLSIRRMWSLYDFSHKALKQIEVMNPDLVYVSGPPNTQYKLFAKYKCTHPEKIVYAEVGDMWPESLPVSEKMKKALTFPMKIWASLRNNYIGKFDYVITECDLFRKKLLPYIQENKMSTLYFCKDSSYFEETDDVSSTDIITLCYVGSINHIIDTELICQLINAIVAEKDVEFHLVGAGEKKALFCEEIKATGAKLIDHGEVYDPIEKKKIFRKCMFALNVMKKSVCVGMTMKSLDYFQFGIPILNNIAGDIWEIIEKENVGFNFNAVNVCQIAKEVCTTSEAQWLEKKYNTEQVFQRNFSIEEFERKFRSIMDKSKEC